MNQDQARELFNEIVAKTKENKLKWQPVVGEPDQFIVAMGGRFKLRAYPWTRKGEGPPSITLYEGDDNLVIDLTHMVSSLNGTELFNAYSLIRDRALRIDEKIGDVLTKLRELR